MRVIAVINQKGGVGKTITSVHISAFLARRGKKTLLIDLDPQANSSLLLNVKASLNELSIYDVMVEDAFPEDVIVDTSIENLSLLPSNLNLAEAEIDLVEKPGREIKLAEKLYKSIERETFVGSYDYIIIDCSPSLNILTVNALLAAKEIFVPVQMSYFALKGAGHLIDIVKLVNEELGHGVEITGVIPTFFKEGSGEDKEVLKKVKETFKDSVFDTVIRSSDIYDKAAAQHETVFDYKPDSGASSDYKNLVKEIIDMEDDEEGKSAKKGFLSSLFKKTH